ncbi:MAG: putative iron-regulated protein [Sphingobacteriales bacterium]|jgi:uncharacterized iron-regulated protein
MKRSILLALILFSFSAFAGNKNPAYRIFTKNGKEISFKKYIKELNKANIVLFGELHNNSMCHWIQLETASKLFERTPLVLGAEMFERDNNSALAKYVKGEIDKKALDSLIRLWPNHSTDYAPLVDFAKDNNLDFIATNVPRRFANKVFHNGFEALDSLKSSEKKWVAPLPISYDPELSLYAGMAKMMPGHGAENLPKAQAIKDATMAYFIAKGQQPDHVFLHFNGTYHSNEYQGINWYLNKYDPAKRITTIATVEQKNIKKLEDGNKKLADFILVIPENMTKTY